MADYTKKTEYDKYIKEHVKEILIQCDYHHIPVFMCFAVNNENGTTQYINEMLSAAAEGVTLNDDKICKHALVMDNFDVVPRITIPSYEEEMEVIADNEKETKPGKDD